MGHYTGLRCKVILHEEFLPVLQQSFLTKEWQPLGYAFLDQFAKLERAHDLLSDSLDYMPWEWEEAASGEWKTSIVGDCLTLQCSLKNYNNIIQSFLSHVLPLVAKKSITIEIYDDQWECSQFFELTDRQVVPSDREGITYKYKADWY